MDRPRAGRSESVRAAPGRNRTTVTVTSHGPVTVTARVGRDSRVPALTRSQRRTRTAAAAGTASSDSELGLKFKFTVPDSGFSAQPEGPPVQAGPVGSAGQ